MSDFIYTSRLGNSPYLRMLCDTEAQETFGASTTAFTSKPGRQIPLNPTCMKEFWLSDHVRVIDVLRCVGLWGPRAQGLPFSGAEVVGYKRPA